MAPGAAPAYSERHRDRVIVPIDANADIVSLETHTLHVLERKSFGTLYEVSRGGRLRLASLSSIRQAISDFTDNSCACNLAVQPRKESEVKPNSHRESSGAEEILATIWYLFILAGFGLLCSGLLPVLCFLGRHWLRLMFWAYETGIRHS